MKISFKGYDAAPLKNVFVERYSSTPIRREMEDIAKNENFNIGYLSDYLKWAQDDKSFIERNGKTHLVGNLRVDEDFMEDLDRIYGISSSYAKTFVTGGNSFIGKYPNGEKWMLIGEDEVRPQKTKADISKEYGIDEKNIFTIPQQYYHLDMFMRPIGYPYVLVDSPTLVKKKLDRMSYLKSPYETIQLRSSFNQFERQRQKSGYSSSSDTIETLKKAGFKPIEVAGVFGSGINFLNAIVNKHQDGTISYITNSTACESQFISQIEKDFEKELREKVENIRDVYFVSGKNEVADYDQNYVMNNLFSRGGGIHCMSLEEPNFEMWI